MRGELNLDFVENIVRNENSITLKYENKNSSRKELKLKSDNLNELQENLTNKIKYDIDENLYLYNEDIEK